MSVIKEANILNEIPLSIVKAGQIIQIEEDGKTNTYLVIAAGQERRLVPVLMHSWRSVNIYDVEQPNIIRVFDNKAKGKCLYVKREILEDIENEKDV